MVSILRMNLIISYPLNINLPVNGDSLSVFAPSPLNVSGQIKFRPIYIIINSLHSCTSGRNFLQVIWQRKKLWLKTHWSENSTVNIIQSLNDMNHLMTRGEEIHLFLVVLVGAVRVSWQEAHPGQLMVSSWTPIHLAFLSPQAVQQQYKS